MQKLVLFDFDGTLADTAPDLAAAANLLRQQHSLAPLPYDALRPFASHGARGLLKAALNIEPDDSGYDQLKAQFLQDYAQVMYQQTRLFDGIAELLAELARQDFAWGIVTNKIESLALPMIRHLGLAQDCAVTVGGDTTAHIKPHPEPLFHAARSAGVQPASCIYIGDDLRDIQAGKAAGMATVAAAYGYCSANPRDWQADALAEQTQDLLPIISGWANT